MSDPNALHHEMRRLLLGELGVDPLALDGDTADRLLAGRLDPADAPPGYAEVAMVLAAAAGPPTPVELAGEAAATATFAAMTRPSARSRRRAGGRRKAFGSRLAVLAAAALCVLLVSGVAAAATGTLPGPARRMVDSVSRAAHHPPARSAVPRQGPGKVRSGDEGQDGSASVGHAGADREAPVGRSAPAAPTGPDATGRAKGGSCATPLAGRAGVSSKPCKNRQQAESSPAKMEKARARAEARAEKAQAEVRRRTSSRSSSPNAPPSPS